MSDSKSKASSPEVEAFVEADAAETVMTYGDGRSATAKFFVSVVWIGFLAGMFAYVFLYLLPDLAEWRAW